MKLLSKRRYGLILLVSCMLIGGSTIGLSLIDGRAIYIDATAVDERGLYDLTLSDDENKIASFSESHYDTLTSGGATINVGFANLSAYESGYAALGEDSYLYVAKEDIMYNNALTGLSYLTITYDGEAPTIYYSNDAYFTSVANLENDGWVNGGLAASSGQEFIFPKGHNYWFIKSNGNVNITSIVTKYSCLAHDGVIYDGKMDDEIYTDAVKTNSFTLRKDLSNWITFYAARDNQGIYMYVDYNVQSIKNVGSAWYEVDNFEFRIGVDGQPDLTGQVWLSTMGGGSTSDHISIDEYFVSPIKQLSDNHYQVDFEFYLSYNKINNVTKNDILTFSAGSNPAAGWYNTVAFWFEDTFASEEYICITTQGFEWFAIDKVPTSCGNHHFVDGKCANCGEILSEAVSGGGDAWNSNVIKYDFNMNNNLEVIVRLNTQFTSGDHNAPCNKLDHTWVGEIYSPGWNNGGWTFRGDWWSWGSWSPNGEACQAGEEYSNFPDRYAAFGNLDIILLMRWDAESGYFTVNGRYYSNVEGQDADGFYQYIYYKSGKITYRGDAALGIGHKEHANITISSFIVC